MNQEQAKEVVVGLVSVDPQMVTYAKSYFLDSFERDTGWMVKGLLASLDLEEIETVVIHPSVNVDEQLREVAKRISWKLAGAEAVWGLVSSAVFIPKEGNQYLDPYRVGWSTVPPAGGGGRKGGWNFEELSVPMPYSVYMKPSGITNEDRPLTDPDLFLKNIELRRFGGEIAISLKEAVICFKNETYLACLALLGRASEGAWIQLGLAMVNIVADEAKSDKLREAMESPFVGIARKIILNTETYEDKALFGNIYKETGINLNRFKSLVVYSDALRDSRNAIHYGAVPVMENTYDKVAVLLMGIIPNLNTLGNIIDECEKSA